MRTTHASRGGETDEDILITFCFFCSLQASGNGNASHSVLPESYEHVRKRELSNPKKKEGQDRKEGRGD